MEYYRPDKAVTRSVNCEWLQPGYDFQKLTSNHRVHQAKQKSSPYAVGAIIRIEIASWGWSLIEGRSIEPTARV